MDKTDIENVMGSHVSMYDVIDTFIGKKIGYGIAREVYECKLDPSLVVKIENTAGSFQNIKEFEFWQDVQFNKAISKWLAPCTWISASGVVMLQKKVLPIRDSELPKQLPEFLTDVKKDNYGILNKKVVCFDYGLVNILTSTKMKKADWS